MISITIGMPYTQMNQTVKMECKKEVSKNIPYFFTIINENKNQKETKNSKKEKKK